MENSNNVRNATCYFSLSTIGLIIWAVFFVLKLIGPLAWMDWLWVFFPLWIAPACAVGIFLVVLIIAVTIATVNN